MPGLNDHVVLHILADLNLHDLHTVAKCSRRFQVLAQRTFRIALEGRLTLNDDLLNGLDVGQFNLFRVFGPFVKHLVYDSWWSFDTPNIWDNLDITILRSVKIRSKFLNIDYLREQIHRFDELESLVIRADHTLNFNFRQWCPKLKSLALGINLEIDTPEEHFPYTLRTLDMDLYSVTAEHDLTLLLHKNLHLKNLRLHMYRGGPKPNDLFKCLVKAGLHTTMESLAFLRGNIELDYVTRDIAEEDSYELSSKLALFQQLKRLQLTVHNGLGVIANVPLFRSLANLEYLEITVGNKEPEKFLMAFAADIPPNLKEFVIEDWFPISEENWCAFVAAMPTSCKCQMFDFVLNPIEKL